MKKAIIIFIIILALLSGSIILFTNKHLLEINSSETFNSTDEILSIHYLDVGQGDAILIQTPNKTDILIDGGPDNSILNELGKVMPFYDNTIDIIILTHPHSDHVVGLTEVLRRYQINKIYYTGVIHTSPDYIEWLKEIKKQNIQTIIIDEPILLELEKDINLEFLYPFKSLNNKRVTEINNTSIVNRLVYNEISFLFTGDAEIEVEEELMEHETQLSSSVLKAGHHGSHSSSSIDFIKQVNPEISIIQVGTDNKFNHPHLITTKRLERLEIPTYRNDLLGTISIQTNGQIMQLSH